MKRTADKTKPSACQFDDTGILTLRQVQILRLIQDYRLRNGCSPTLQEMAKKLELSKVTVFEHVEALVRKGLLHRSPNKARSLTLDPSVKIPGVQTSSSSKDRQVHTPAGSGKSALSQGAGEYQLVGHIAAGLPLEAMEIPDTLNVSTMFETGSEVFVLCVRGDSMVEDHICDGDYVLVEKTSQARDGQVIVAVLPDGQATLKKIYRQDQGYRLQPANKEFEPIFVDDLDIQGVVMGVLRRF